MHATDSHTLSPSASRRPQSSCSSDRLACGPPWGPLLHEMCVFKHNPMIFIWYQRRWITLVRVGTASQGAAKIPSYCGRLGCTLCGGTCACQMLFSLSFPNLLISLYFVPSNNRKKNSLSEPETRLQATFLSLCLCHQNDKKCLFRCCCPFSLPSRVCYDVNVSKIMCVLYSGFTLSGHR